MKKAEEYFEKIPYSFDIPNIKEWVCDQIRCAQKDAIKATVQACADNAVVEVVDHEEWLIDHLPANNNRGYTILPVYGVDDQSILEVADKLIKELE